jgi:hypothetical protein
VHGCFSSRAEARNFPDTFFFTARELKDAGLPKESIRTAVSQYHAQVLEKGMGELEEMSSDEEEPPEEEELAEADRGREGGGEGGAASVGAAVPAVVQTVV